VACLPGEAAAPRRPAWLVACLPACLLRPRCGASAAAGCLLRAASAVMLPHIVLVGAALPGDARTVSEAPPPRR
jgi:hypothetical protein